MQSTYFKSHPYAKVTIIHSILLVVFMIIMSSCFPQPGEYNGFKDFILAFEFATSMQDIHQLLQNFTANEILKIDRGNYFDFGFMITYSSLIGFLYTKSAEIFDKKWMKIGIVLAGIILLGDFFENIILLKITNIYVSGMNETGITSLVEKLQIVTWIKWGGMAFTFFIFYGIFCRLNWWWRIFGLICLSPILCLVFMCDCTPDRLSIFTGSIYLTFFLLAVFGILYKTKKVA